MWINIYPRAEKLKSNADIKRELEANIIYIDGHGSELIGRSSWSISRIQARLNKNSTDFYHTEIVDSIGQ